MDTSILNPSVIFHKNYEFQIQKTRNTLFNEINGISSDFSIEARKILNNKLNLNDNRPLLGELFPWIIKDLVDADTDSTHQISVGWLGIYLYTLFLDEHVDNPKPINPKEFITGSILAKTGLLKISRLTNNTPYEEYVDNALSFSAKNQNIDTQFQKQTATDEVKIKYSEGKNYVLLSCAGALAAQNSKYGEFITEFSKSLLLTLQYLDDLSDFREDYRLGNITIMLNQVFENNSKLDLKNITNRQLLEELIVTGSLQRAIEKIQKLLNQSIALINSSSLIKQSKKPSIVLFVSLQAYVISFNEFLKNCHKDFLQYPIDKQNAILDSAEEYISLIAQST